MSRSGQATFPGRCSEETLIALGRRDVESTSSRRGSFRHRYTTLLPLHTYTYIFSVTFLANVSGDRDPEAVDVLRKLDREALHFWQ